MKSLDELKSTLRRQWENAAVREGRLLGAEGSWPVVLTIGRPSPRVIRTDFDAIKRHVQSWRQVTCGEVVWRPIRYRDMSSAVDIPITWRLNKPTEWIEACRDRTMSQEFDALALMAAESDSIFRSLLIRRRTLWRDKSVAEVIQAAQLAMLLKPGIATGRPLRALSIAGIDTKFFERHEHLVTAMLDVRFDGEVSAIGIEAFLGAYSDADHWLLVMDLDVSLLPFRCQRVRSSELGQSTIPGRRLLIIENESCQHHLPRVPDTIAVLGAGFDLSWISNPSFSEKRIAYWGDIDTWGLQFLAKAKAAIGSIFPLMMTSDVFKTFADAAVSEPVIATEELPEFLDQSERALYQIILRSSRGRLEQEFLPAEFVRENILKWANMD